MESNIKQIRKREADSNPFKMGVRNIENKESTSQRKTWVGVLREGGEEPKFRGNLQRMRTINKQMQEVKPSDDVRELQR